MGSSPRVRGKLRFGGTFPPSTRLIPACAGKTDGYFLRKFRSWAHPRVCGENLLLSVLVLWVAGSSPRVRGKRRLPVSSIISRGLIPACAGKTFPRESGDEPVWAHPRVCGENAASAAREKEEKGSSPRVRGKRRLKHPSICRDGLIPACAGKTSRIGNQRRTWRAHPRVCGENLQDLSLTRLLAGSSPRVRGKLVPFPAYNNAVGLIPACAGKTQHSSSAYPPVRAHPRVCGENSPRATAVLS